MKQRVAYLVIDGKRFGDEETGLNVSFDVPYTGTNLVPNNSTFTITNLNADDLFEVVTNTARFTERRRSIECYAGYKGYVRKIFAGQILQSSPTDMPDTKVNITAYSDIENMGNAVQNKSFNNPTFAYLIDDARKECGYGIYIPEDVKNSSILQSTAGKHWSFTGSSNGYLQRVQTDLSAANSQSKEAICFSVANNILYVNWEGKSSNAIIPIIDENSGLINIPTPTESGINLQVLMDVSLNPLQTIYVKSKRLKLYNGLYNIVNLRHHGTLRGRDWYTDLECVKVGK